MCVLFMIGFFFFFQAEDGIRDLVRSRGLGDVYKRQGCERVVFRHNDAAHLEELLQQAGPDRPKLIVFESLSLIHI
mgnify:CR=1 FL=1